VRDGKVVWSVSACLATIAEVRLPSPDGLGLLVLEEQPRTSDDPLATPVARLYQRGVLLRTLVAGDLSPGSRGLRVEAGKLAWLGAKPPEVAADGVHLLLADGHAALVAWDGSAPARAQR
jgi:hypothetical protein